MPWTFSSALILLLNGAPAVVVDTSKLLTDMLHLVVPGLPHFR